MKLEKIFLKYILEHPQFFSKVEPEFFEEPKLKFIYEISKAIFVQDQSHGSPNNHQIYQMVRNFDRDQEHVSDAVLRKVLETNISQYQRDQDDNWLHNQFKGWLIKRGLRFRIKQGINEIRNLDQVGQSLEDTINIAQRVKDLVGDITVIANDEDDGWDFFNRENHMFEMEGDKIPSGWTNIDNLFNGGWDRQTLNIFIAPSNVGKSLWMCNCLSNVVKNGFNCLYISLEMSREQVFRRLAIDLYNIPSEEYDDVQRNPPLYEEKMNAFRQNFGTGLLDDEGPGKLWVKCFQTGQGTIADVDNYLKEQSDKGINFDFICIDYLTIMNASNKNGNLYENGKKLAEGARGLAQKWNCVMVSAVQVSRDAFNANDIQMKDISESKAILETCDTMFAIIRTDSMRAQNMYLLKLLKFRNGEFKWVKCKFDFNPKYLRISNDVVAE